MSDYIGWTIINVGPDNSLLLQAPNGERRRMSFREAEVRELADCLREMHDFCVPTTGHRHKERAFAAHRRAGDLLERLEK